MTKVNHITHKKSDVANKAPKVGDLANGEIAVNYAKDTERMYIKNTSSEIIPFSSDHIIIGGIIDTVLANKTMARGYDTSNPTLANVYGSKESLNSVLKHYKMGLFKDGALVKECAPCRITKAVDGSDIKIDGSEGDIMLYTDVPIYRDRCRVSGVTVPNSTATTHNAIGLGLMPHQVGGKEAKKMNPFAFTPGYVQLNRAEDRYYSCYNPSYSGSGVGMHTEYGNLVPTKDVQALFTTNFIREKGAQGGYPVMYQSAIDSMRRSRNKGPKYKGIFYEFYEMWLIAMYLELGTLNFSRHDYFGIGCTFAYYWNIPINASDWISGGTNGMLIKNINGDGTDRCTRLRNNDRYKIGESSSYDDEWITYGQGTMLTGFLGSNTCNFEEALESQRFVDALVKSDLASKVDGATVLEYDDDVNKKGYVKVSENVDVYSGSGMTEGKKYYIIRNVPNCQGIGDGVMTYVLNVFVKTKANKDVYTSCQEIINDNKEKETEYNIGGKDIIFKFSYPTYRGLELFSGAYTPIEGINYVTAYNGDMGYDISLWYAKDFTDIKYNPSNYTETDAKVPIEKPDKDIPFLKGFVKASGNHSSTNLWVSKADYDISLFCATECSGASSETYECAYTIVGSGVDNGYKEVNKASVSSTTEMGTASRNPNESSGRSFRADSDVISSSYFFAGGFSIGNPTL